uniref:RNA methyltransferase n=1 Tax=Phytophthora ramorum TaxID=164328 RepID=H3GJA5_PHYRM
MASNDAEGHVLGNFHAYYSFNPVHERLRFMDVQTANALRRALLVRKSAEETSTVVDIGCNEGDLTIGLYDALNGRARLADAKQIDDVASFDLMNISTLNERMQKDKKQVEYVIQDKGETSHRRRYVVELLVDGKAMGHGEGVSKKVAKAKAAEVALQVLDGSDSQKTQEKESKDEKVVPEQLPLTEQELATRKSLMVLGVDIDKVLIERATKKSVQLTVDDQVQFRHVDVMTSKFNEDIAPFLELAKRSTAERKFDLVTCFSVTMWIHLNNGDEGLWTFLETVSDMTEHLIIEPQTWKCYRNAQKRLNRMHVEVPQSFREIKVRTDVVEKIDAFLLSAGRFRFKAQLGKTNWSRNTQMEEVQDYSDIIYAHAVLLAVVLVPTLVRVRIVYTFLWNLFTVIAIKMESRTAQGLATVMGLSVMLSWYMLRYFDRSVFDSVLLGWFGLLSKYRVFRGLANTGDFLLHFVCPLALAAKYLEHVEVWMALPVLGYVDARVELVRNRLTCSFSVLWVYFVAGGSLVANHVYHFSPPRPVQFWAVASASMLVGNLTVPLGCVFAQRSGLPDLLVRGVEELAAPLRQSSFAV